MTRLLARIAAGAALAGVGLLLVGLACGAAGARLNVTRSLAPGLYWVTDRPVEKGAYVMFCPPQAAAFDAAKARGYIGPGFCRGEYGYMLKRVLAAKGDWFSVADDGVRVNGRLLPLSKPLRADRAARPLPVYRTEHYELGPDELLLMSDVSELSFDARYFGPVKRSQIASAVFPVFTW